MQASAGGGISGAATGVAGPESLSPRERPENASVERVLRERDGLGFCGSGLAGRQREAEQRMWAQVRQEVQERLDQVRWEERQAQRWQEQERSWWLEQRRAVWVGSGRRSTSAGRQRQWAAAGRRKGPRGTSSPASLCRRQVRAAGVGWRHSLRYRRLGGGGKRGWVT